MYCTACRAKELLSCGFLAFPAAAAAVGICKQNTDMTKNTQGRQGPALYVQYDSYLGVASGQQGGIKLR